MAAKRSRRFIRKAIKRPGALTKAVGGKPSKNVGKVRTMARGRGKNAQRARFYLNVLRPAGRKRRRR